MLSCEVRIAPPGEIGPRYANVLKPGWKRLIDKRDVPF